MSVDHQPSTPEEVGERLLRRIEVAKMTRKLQDRLALASYKAKHGLDNADFSTVEAHIVNKLKRRRAQSSVISSSSNSSSSPLSDHHIFSSSAIASSPLTAPVFSDALYGSDPMIPEKRTRFDPRFLDHTNINAARGSRKRTHSMAPPSYQPSRSNWKSTHNLPESSPLQRRLDPSFRTSAGPSISFASQDSTIPASPPFDPLSDDDALPVHSFRQNGSPPRTPPPTRNRGLRSRKNASGEDGAELLLYLATSPSPANSNVKARVFPPSTPPPHHTGLPPSLLATPGGTNLFTGFSTPGQNFNFSDFVNVTPSPAQGAFGNRTPGIMKTPLAAKDARRRLNYDGLVPPGQSPRVESRGLGMELGGELRS